MLYRNGQQPTYSQTSRQENASPRYDQQDSSQRIQPNTSLPHLRDENDTTCEPFQQYIEHVMPSEIKIELLTPYSNNRNDT